MKEGVSIIGVGCTKFGDLRSTPEIKDLTLQELASKAAQEALEDAKINPREIDMVIVGNVMQHTSQMNSGYSHLCKWLGVQYKAGVDVAAGCSTTNTGAVMAAMGIASGAYRTALVVGFEATQSKAKDNSPYEREDVSTQDQWLWTDYCVDQAYTIPQGYDIFGAMNGLFALGYCRKYGISLDDYDRAMFELCRTRRLHGSMTPKAFIQETLEEEAKKNGFDDPWEFWQSRFNPMISYPTRLRSVVNPADGASAMILTSTEEAKRYPDTRVDMLGFGLSIADAPWTGHECTSLPIDRIAFKKSYDMAGITPFDIDYLHVHDCSHIISLNVAEDSGYLPKGQAWKYALDGRLRFDSDKPMSTHGGRHSFGHAWAASAGSDTYEACMQMRGLAGKRQIKPFPQTCVIHTNGYAMIANVLTLRKG